MNQIEKSKQCKDVAAHMFRIAAAELEQNPIKVYSAIYLLGDLFLGINPAGGALWKIGAGIAIAANINKFAFGRGGGKVDSASLKLSPQDAWQVARQTFSQPFALLTRRHWQETWNAFARIDGKQLIKKVKRSAEFWKYPLDAGWLLYAGTGVLYATDALLLRSQASPIEALCGIGVAIGSTTGFMTDNNKLVGRIFSGVTALLLVDSAIHLNPALFAASLVYLYANHVIGKVSSQHQSAHTANSRPDALSPVSAKGCSLEAQ